ncbi:MAG: hypothetical protein ACPG5B_00115 [Chitinophagales bacterium]
MKPLKTILAFLFICSISFSACQNDAMIENVKPQKVAKEDLPTITTEAGNFKLFQAKKRPYEILLPEGWKTKEHWKSGSLKSQVPNPTTKAENPFRENILIIPMKGRINYNKKTKQMESAPINLKDFVKKHIDVLKTKYKDVKILAQTDMELNKKATTKLVYQHLYKEDHEEKKQLLQLETYILIDKNEAFLISFVDSADDFQKSQKMFDTIIGSLKFK